MSVQMIVRLEPETKDQLTKLARLEGKSTNFLLKEIIDSYIKDHDIGSYIDDLWERIGSKLRSKGVNESDIGKAVREARAGN